MLVLFWMTASYLYAQPSHDWQAQEPFKISTLVRDIDIIEQRLVLIGQERTISMDTTLGIISILGNLSTEEKEVMSVLLSDGDIEISEVGDRNAFLNKVPIHERAFYFLDTNNVEIHHTPRFPSHVLGECSSSAIAAVNRELRSELGGMIFQDWHLAWTRAENGFHHLILMNHDVHSWSINEHVVSASMVQDSDRPSLSIEFDLKGTEMLANLTESNIAKVLVLHIGDLVIMAPRVHDQLKAGKLEISTSTDERLRLLIALLETERFSNSYLVIAE